MSDTWTNRTKVDELNQKLADASMAGIAALADRENLIQQVNQLRAELAAANQALYAIQSALNRVDKSPFTDPVECIDWMSATMQHLEKRVAELDSQVKASCADWADDHTRLQAIVNAAIPAADVDGDRYGVPAILDLAEILQKRIKELEAKQPINVPAVTAEFIRLREVEQRLSKENEELKQAILSMREIGDLEEWKTAWRKAVALADGTAAMQAEKEGKK